jgi:hypothetical protein
VIKCPRYETVWILDFSFPPDAMLMLWLTGVAVLATKSMFRADVAVPGFERPFPALLLNRLGGSAALVRGAPGIAPDAELLLSFGWDKAFWRCELRNGPAAPSIDLSVIAKAIGGGGHPHAAGFCCAKLPFELR